MTNETNAESVLIKHEDNPEPEPAPAPVPEPETALAPVPESKQEEEKYPSSSKVQFEETAASVYFNQADDPNSRNIKPPTTEDLPPAKKDEEEIPKPPSSALFEETPESVYLNKEEDKEKADTEEKPKIVEKPPEEDKTEKMNDTTSDPTFNPMIPPPPIFSRIISNPGPKILSEDIDVPAPDIGITPNVPVTHPYQPPPFVSPPAFRPYQAPTYPPVQPPAAPFTQPPKVSPAQPKPKAPITQPQPRPRPAPSVQPSVSIQGTKYVPKPIIRGTITKSDPKYSELMTLAFKHTDYALNEIQFKNVASAKQFVMQALGCLRQLAE